MRQFFTHNTDGAFGDLERRATSSCIVFLSQELPPFCVPGYGRIGFSIDAVTGVASLLVDKGIFYCGSDQKISDWLKTGSISFPNFNALRFWIQSDLEADYRRSLDSLTQSTTQRMKSIQPKRADFDELSRFPQANLIYQDLFVQTLIKKFALTWDLEVKEIGRALEWKVMDRLAENPDRTCLDVLDEMFSGAFALASVRGFSSVSLTDEPRIQCKGINK